VELTREICKAGLAEEVGGFLGGKYGYGADFENEVFMMKSFCWCGEEDCPWCATCECEYEYYIDDRVVDFDEWVSFFEEQLGECPVDDEEQCAEWERAAEELNKRRSTKLVKVCDNCKRGWPLPNFWYKPSDLRITWYKYIGRSMEYNKKVSDEEWDKIFKHCLDSITKAST